MPKYQKYYQDMIDQNLKMFSSFQTLHDNYEKNPTLWQIQFNKEGGKVLEIIREWERRLCQHSERGQYGKYSQLLAEKFWNTIRLDFPRIDFIGVSQT
ncbi:hypothetical protein HYW55_05210 [Candidatus Gottesmanbacteria bacterium]|nr:hypothetical protein [Candidatus Gottesmanbacteria bacterium]